MKNLLFAIVFTCVAGISSAQFNPGWNTSYQHTATANFSNEGRKIVVDNNKNIYVLCDVTSDKNLSGVVTGTTYYYTVLIKYGQGGSVTEEIIDVQDHFSAGFSHRSAFGMEIDATGNIYIGYSVYNQTTDYDIRIAKYNSSLSQLWAYDYNSPGIDSGIVMTISTTNVIYAVAQTDINGTKRHRIIKANGAGSTSTGLYTFNSQPDFINNIVLDNAQNIYVTGHRIVSGYKTILTASVTNAGNFRWEDVFNGGSVQSDDIGRNLTVGGDGEIYVTGTSDRATSNGLDIVVIKYQAANGGRKWESYQNYNPNDGGFFIHAPGTAFVYAASVAGTNIIMDRLFMTTGQLNRRTLYTPVPAEPHNSVGNVTLNDMIVSSRPNFYLTGSVSALSTASQLFTCSYLVRINYLPRGGSRVAFATPVEGNWNESYAGVGISFTNDPQQVAWIRDYFATNTSHTFEAVETHLFNLPVPIRMASQGGQAESVTVYPNPASDLIQVRAGSIIEKLELYNMAGQLVRSWYDTGDYDLVDVASLKKGLYSLKVTTAGSIHVKKLFIR